MFRDESSKVIQKAHAQWGSSGSPIEASSSASTSASAWAIESPGASPDSLSSGTPSPPHRMVHAKLPKKVNLSMEQQGLHFYINRYLMNHPDSPRTGDQVAAYCSSAGASQNVMIAVGLSGLSNLMGNKNMNLLARSKYVTALKQTGQLIASNDPANFVARVRSVVTLALFEVKTHLEPYMYLDEVLTKYRLSKVKDLKRQWDRRTHTSMAQLLYCDPYYHSRKLPIKVRMGC